MPTLSDLDAAMLRPGRSVPAVSRLGGGAIAMTAPDRPWRVVGDTAAVYQLRQPSGRVFALRCPMADRAALDPALADRMHALAGDPSLASLRIAGGPLVADLSFLADGVSLPAADFRSATHPLMAMEWVAGPTLLAAADRACQADDAPFLDALADAWAGIVTTLAGVRFDHGDLNVDNGLVRPTGGLALVDYDSCAWPGAPRPPATKPGPGYLHPSGGVAPVGRRDAFPSLVIYVSLRVLARWPGLREQHGDRPGRVGGVLLFGGRDLRDPDDSPLFGALRRLDDPASRHLIGVLREACSSPVTEAPAMSEVLSGEHKAASERAARPAPRSAPTPAERREAATAAPSGSPEARERQTRLTRLNSLLLAGDEDGARRYWSESGLENDLDAVRQLGPRMAELTRRRLLRQAREAADAGDSTALLRMWAEGRFAEYPPAAPLLPAVEAARRRSGSVERLRRALEADDAATVLRLWPELRGDSLVSSLAIRAQSVFAREVTAALNTAVARGDDEEIIAAAREAEASGVAFDVAMRRAARAAAERREARRALRAAVASDDRATLATLAISGRLEDLGTLEPAAVRATLRALAWPHLELALASGDDAAILAAYDADLFDDDGALALEQRARVELAQKRTAWLGEIRAALRRRDVAALRTALTKAPPGAERRLSQVERDRVERLTTGDDAVERLAAALRDGPDGAIVEALREVEASGVALPEGLDWVAVRGVVDRVSLADAIRSATADPPDYARLAGLLPAVRSAMTGQGREGQGGAGFDVARLEADVFRAAHLARLREALVSDDPTAIAAAARPDPYGALARLTEEQRARVWQALGVNDQGAEGAEGGE